MLKVALVTHWDWVLYNFRLPLAQALREQGHEVVLVCPFGEYTARLRAGGFRCVHWSVNRRSLNPFREVAAIRHLVRIYRAERPDIVHHYTIKPNLYGSLAVRLMRRERAHLSPVVINTFTGLGFLFSSHATAIALRMGVLPTLRWALWSSKVWTVFQNRQDLDAFVRWRLVPPERTAVIASSGVDTQRFHPDGPAAHNTRSQAPIVLMASRLLWDKGVKEFAEAARLLRRKGVDAQFWLAGVPDQGNPACVPEAVLREWQHDGLVLCLGHREDMPELLRQADIAILPSYQEGVPRYLLEAAATGLPLVATDIEGCRMVVQHDVNGFLVPTRDHQALAEAVGRLVQDVALRRRMGQASRGIAVAEFDERRVMAQWLTLYRDLCRRTE